MKNKKLGDFIDANGNKHIPKSTDVIYWRISVYVLIEDNNKFFFTKPNWSNKYELPGGGMETNESMFESLSRELQEEAGLVLDEIEEIPFYINESNFYYYNDVLENYNHSIGLFFKGKINKEKMVEKTDKNIIDTRWFSKDELDKIELHPMHKIVIDFIK